ncbi:hypothetical protein J6590_060344 [Homalodisca vitripennis]|nr:hypothetical protein J6590_060344 [Homalodisca vitripennis]
MTSPTRSPFSNPFKIRRRGSLFSPQAAYWTHAAARIPPQYMNSFTESFPLLSTALHLQDLHKTSGDPGLPAALTEDLDDPVLRDSPKVHHQSFLFRLYRDVKTALRRRIARGSPPPDARMSATAARTSLTSRLSPSPT